MMAMTTNNSIQRECAVRAALTANFGKPSAAVMDGTIYSHKVMLSSGFDRPAVRPAGWRLFTFIFIMRRQ